MNGFINSCPNCRTVYRIYDGEEKFACCRKCSSIKSRWSTELRGWKPVMGKTTKRKCGEECWMAISPTCSCSCGGKNHGIGFTLSPKDIYETAYDPDFDFLADVLELPK
jgi:hypothetical protein